MATESSMFFRFSCRSSFSSFSGRKKMGTRQNTESHLTASPSGSFCIPKPGPALDLPIPSNHLARFTPKSSPDLLSPFSVY